LNCRSRLPRRRDCSYRQDDGTSLYTALRGVTHKRFRSRQTKSSLTLAFTARPFLLGNTARRTAGSRPRLAASPLFCTVTHLVLDHGPIRRGPRPIPLRCGTRTASVPSRVHWFGFSTRWLIPRRSECPTLWGSRDGQNRSSVVRFVSGRGRRSQSTLVVVSQPLYGLTTAATLSFIQTASVLGILRCRATRSTRPWPVCRP